MHAHGGVEHGAAAAAARRGDDGAVLGDLAAAIEGNRVDRSLLFLVSAISGDATDRALERRRANNVGRSAGRGGGRAHLLKLRLVEFSEGNVDRRVRERAAAAATDRRNVRALLINRALLVGERGSREESLDDANAEFRAGGLLDRTHHITHGTLVISARSSLLLLSLRQGGCVNGRSTGARAAATVKDGALFRERGIALQI